VFEAAYRVGMTVDFQASLFDAGFVAGARPASGTASLGPLGATVRRHRLAHGAWVDVRPGWVSGSDDLFAKLVGAVPWKAERRQMYERVVDVPRLLKFYGAGESLPDPLLERARGALNAHYADLDEELTTAGFCYYRDGRDSVAWHGDRVAKTLVEPVVAILSLGSERTLRLRPKAGAKEAGSATRPFRLIPGDLFVMGGPTQATWQHSVPKVARAGARVSLQFRHST
jgi:alkylated DNA repair dioxygenase AlkB